VDLEELVNEVEAVSEIYARKHAIERTDTWFLLKLHEEVGELTQAFLMKTGQARAKGRSAAELDADFRAEVADVLCHVLLLARHQGIDIEAAVAEKWLVRNPKPSA
jgi:NTP pyrophosphatase (non-canonical NTP hydrolase)